MRKWNNDNDYTVATSIVFVDNRDGDAFYSHSKQEKKKGNRRQIIVRKLYRAIIIKPGSSKILK